MTTSRRPVLKMVGTLVVISGVAGKFPASRNLGDFRENLFNGVDMISGESPGQVRIFL